MKERTHDLLVFIGRFQPFHVGHRRVIELALEQAKQVLVLVGSSYQPRTIKNPFTYEERRQMIEMSLDPQHLSRLTIRPLRDYLYNDNKWMQEVQKHVDLLMPTIKPPFEGKSPLKVGIIGHDKDQSSWYLNAFPQWDFIEVGRSYIDTIDASTVRDMWLSGQSPTFTSGALNTDVHSFIYKKFPKKEYERLVREYTHIKEYKQQWEVSPYPVIFQTCDAVVIQSGHVLLVRRRSAPGEGLYAMPGGFVNVNETIENGMIRELREETKIKVPDPVLRGSIKARHVFDAPGRSLRGRTITNAFLIELPAGPLPTVKGSDDAVKAKWVSLSDFEKMEDQMFEDHHYIVSYFLGRV
jgi:bifunctional NMN adenylyltransferase/nudix hydrolase